jgi:hypothetical protein
MDTAVAGLIRPLPVGASPRGWVVPCDGALERIANQVRRLPSATPEEWDVNAKDGCAQKGCPSLPCGVDRASQLHPFFNMLLRKSQSKSPTFLSAVERTFGSSGATLSLIEVIDMFSRSCSNTIGHADREASIIPEIKMPVTHPDIFTRSIIQVLGLDPRRSITFANFMLEFFGRSKIDVVLHIYDLSGGLAANFAPVLIGESLEGVWHSGVVAFGREYFFNKWMRHDVPGKTPWGEPTKRVTIGSTWCTKDEFTLYLVEHVNTVFTEESYDVMSHSCNHCSDLMCMFLTNKHIPAEVLYQGDFLMQKNFVKALKPLFQRLWGGRATEKK